jgi:hypothetical protein
MLLNPAMKSSPSTWLRLNGIKSGKEKLKVLKTVKVPTMKKEIKLFL